MEVTTLPKVVTALERLQYEITVDPEVAARARLAIERMVAIGGTPAKHPHRGLSPAGTAADPGE